MFSTGPMFLSAQYGLYTASHPPSSENPGGEVRILPKSLYGKNAKPEEAPHSYFTHYYGSSWHADDAAFIGFLGKWGKILMWVGLSVLVFGIIRLALAPHAKQRRYSLRRIGGYEVLMPRWKTRNGRWYLDLGWFTLPSSSSSAPPPSPISLTSDDDSDDDVGLLPLTIDTRSLSPTPSDMSLPEGSSSSFGRPLVDVFRNAGRRLRTLVSGESAAYSSLPSQPRSHSRRRSRVLFFLPAFFSPSQGVELPRESVSLTRRTPSTTSLHAEYPPDKSTGLMPVADIPIHSRAGSSTSDASDRC